MTYAAPISEPEITDSLVVIEGQVDFEDWPEVQTNRNELWVAPQGEWIEGVDYQFLVWNPKTLRRKLFEPEVWDSTEYGDIEINLQNVDSTDIHFVQLLSPRGMGIYLISSVNRTYGFAPAFLYPYPVQRREWQ